MDKTMMMSKATYLLIHLSSASEAGVEIFDLCEDYFFIKNFNEEIPSDRVSQLRKCTNLLDTAAVSHSSFRRDDGALDWQIRLGRTLCQLPEACKVRCPNPSRSHRTSVLMELPRIWKPFSEKRFQPFPGMVFNISSVFSSYEAVQIFYGFGACSDAQVFFRVLRDFNKFPWGFRIAPRNAVPDVHLIILDSVSHRTFRRFLPLAHGLFEADHHHHFAMLFPGAHTISAIGTCSALIPLLHGGLRYRHLPSPCVEHVGDEGFCAKDKAKSLRAPPCPHLVSRGILNLARRAGFVVGMSSDWVLPGHDGFESYASADHVLPPALCDPGSTTWDSDKNTCYGNICFQNQRTYARAVFDHATEVFLQYPDHPKFVVSMLKAAHQCTGVESAKLVESDVYSHLKDVLSKDSMYRQSVIIVIGDHGQHQIACDFHNPFMGVFAPRMLMDTSQGRQAVAALQQNAARSSSGTPSTMWDVYATLRHLVDWGQLANEPEPKTDPDYFGLQEIGEGNEILASYSMGPTQTLMDMTGLAEVQENGACFVIGGAFAPKSLFTSLAVGRDCQQAGIAKHHCTLGKTPDKLVDCHHTHHTVPSPSRRLASTFSLLDVDKSGSLDHGELYSMFEIIPRLRSLRLDAGILQALFDSNRDGELQLEETLFLGFLEASKDPMGDEAFWCYAGIVVAGLLVKILSGRAKAMGDVCKPMILSRLDSVVVSRPRFSDANTLGLTAYITLTEGIPPSRYFGSLLVQADESKGPNSSSVSLSFMPKAITVYNKYERCTPPGGTPEYCICVVSENSEH